MTWWITGLFLILTIVFLAGKGSFLIAGYNTASKKDKERYDEKKLCRLMGICMGIVTLALAVGSWLGEDVPGWMQYGFVILVLADVLAIFILSNTVCVRKDVRDKEEESPEEKKRNSRRVKISFLMIAALFAFVGVILTTGSIKVKLNEENMEIVGSWWPDMKVDWEKIQSVSCTDQVKSGARTGGLGSLRLQEGRFENSEFGSYARYTYVRCKKYVVIEMDGGILVVNQRTEEETEELYERILDRVGDW